MEIELSTYDHFKFDGTSIAEHGMFSYAIIKAFDIAKDLDLGLVACIKKPLLHALAFERADKRLGKSMVPTIFFPAHAR
jgi:hypothetical protein|tara:strand:+ start:238 stop:474 length:237 start_codon:yes stop_codon:yes gene_type:complete